MLVAATTTVTVSTFCCSGGPPWRSMLMPKTAETPQARARKTTRMERALTRHLRQGSSQDGYVDARPCPGVNTLESKTSRSGSRHPPGPRDDCHKSYGHH